MTTEELLREYAGTRDPQVFAELVERHQRLLWVVAFRTMGSDTLVADVVQDAWIVIARRAETYRGGSATHWLSTVVRNEAINAVRRQAIARRCLPSVSAQVLQSLGQELSDYRNRALPERYAELSAAVARLPLHIAAVVELVDLAGVKYKDAAAHLGIPTGTVRSRRHRGLQLLRQFMVADSGN